MLYRKFTCSAPIVLSRTSYSRIGTSRYIYTHSNTWYFLPILQQFTAVERGRLVSLQTSCGVFGSLPRCVSSNFMISAVNKRCCSRSERYRHEYSRICALLRRGRIEGESRYVSEGLDLDRDAKRKRLYRRSTGTGHCFALEVKLCNFRYLTHKTFCLVYYSLR